MVLNNFLKNRFTTKNESWEQIATRVAKICKEKKNEWKIKKYFLEGIMIPGGQILRGNEFAGNLMNTIVIKAELTDTSQEIANKIKYFISLGFGVGIYLSEWTLHKISFDKRRPLLEVINFICTELELLWQNGLRRTATMITLDFIEQDLEELLMQISKNIQYRHINIGILISDEQLRDINLENNSFSNSNIRFENITSSIYNSGNPGIIFIDTVMAEHPLKNEIINSCNSCAEQFLIPNESCPLASINLASLFINNEFYWELLKDTIHSSVEFLNDVIDSSLYPDKDTLSINKNRRRIGLGVMGFASLIGKMNLKYGESDCIQLANKIALFLKQESNAASLKIGNRKGGLKIGNYKSKLHNLYLNCIAPTGAISAILEVSSGIEPFFGKKISKETINLNFENVDQKEYGYNIHYTKHIDVVAAWQKYIDGGISKTINLPEDSKSIDIKNSIFYAWKNKCKGISIYRMHSRKGEIQIQ